MLERDAKGDLLFPIRSAPGRYFYAGHLPKQRQALIGCGICGPLTVAIFDAGGSLTQVIHHELPSPSVIPDSKPVHARNEEEFYKCLHREFGFSPGLIRIKEFHIPEEMFAVYHLPQHLQKFLENPNDPIFDDEDHEALPGMIREWNEWGQFVLEWGNDFWLDSTGEVVAS
jgi:hypothetical protein